jgi:hypothetical protein
MKKPILAFIIIIFAFFAISCNSNSNKSDNTAGEDSIAKENVAEKIYLELIDKHIPSARDGGSCNVGNSKGDAFIQLTKGGLSVSVKYRVITSFSQYTGEFEYSRWVEESGNLLDLKLTNDDQNQGYYQISGKWKNNTAGDGGFTLKLFEETKKNTLLIQISGSSWSYFENIEFDEQKFNEIKALLRNPNAKINPSNKPTETAKNTELNTQSKPIIDLCSYGEYISQSNKIDEFLEFTRDENEQLVVQYRTSNKNNTKLGHSGNKIYFPNSSNKKYQIVNIKDDNTGFDLINPDGTIQSFQAIEH